MRVIPSAVLLSLVPLAVLPTWHSSCLGQDTAIAKESLEASQQPQEGSSQQPAGPTPNTNPNSQETTTPPAGAASPSSSLDDTVDAGEMDDDLDHAPRELAKWNEYRGPHFTAKAGLGFLVEAAGTAQESG